MSEMCGKPRVGPLRFEQADREVDRVLGLLIEVVPPALELVGELDLPAHDVERI